MQKSKGHSAFSNNGNTTKVVLADPHTLVRRGIRALLNEQGSIDVVADVGDGLSAVEVVEREKPDLLLMELHLPRLQGSDVIRQVRSSNKTHIIVLTTYQDEFSVREALRNGAEGYVLKDSDPEELFDAIRLVKFGTWYICQSLQSRFMHGLKNILHTKMDKGLTNRETMVFRLAAEGKTAAEIARALSISRRTAEAHRASLMKKLGLASQTELVMCALRQEVIAL